MYGRCLYLLIMAGGRTGTLNRLMGLCQCEAGSGYTLAVKAASGQALYRWWEAEDDTTIDNPVVISIPWLMRSLSS